MSKKKQAAHNPDAELESKVRFLLADLLNVDEDEIKLTTKIEEELGADSIDIIEFVMILEEEFDLSLTDTDGEKIVILADAIKTVKRLSPQALAS